jgi:hypothetical protein
MPLVYAALEAAMTGTAATAELLTQAYTIAWKEFRGSESLTRDELLYGPNRLRWYVQIMVDVGERDPDKIAKAALGMLREYEQILRSRARVATQPLIAPAA